MNDSIPCTICGCTGTVENPVYAFQCSQLPDVMIPMCLRDTKRFQHKPEDLSWSIGQVLAPNCTGISFEPETVQYLKVHPGLTPDETAALDENIKAIKATEAAEKGVVGG